VTERFSFGFDIAAKCLSLFQRPLMPALVRSTRFPPAEAASGRGLVCVGGSLEPEWLLDAYGHGIFPWPIIDGLKKMQWWSPDPRAIFEFDRFYVSRRLARTCRSGRFRVTSDRDFAGVIRGCATVDDRAAGTWITPQMAAAYCRLHELGHAHSVEVWQDGSLAGGTYGVAIGGLFAGESMFHRVRDASKVALVCLVAHLRERGFRLFDIQQLTPHTESLGAVEISRADFLSRLAESLALPATFGAIDTWPDGAGDSGSKP
jgi:leucyl/phenylalanyl-tRNA--protein transferase